LAVSIAIPLYVYGLRGILLVLAAGVICVGVASSDEFHQLFVYGRGASVKDVLIDSSGAFVGIYFVRIFGYIARKAFFEPIFHKK
jgi:VanZ family protein